MTCLASGRSGGGCSSVIPARSSVPAGTGMPKLTSTTSRLRSTPRTNRGTPATAKLGRATATRVARAASSSTGPRARGSPTARSGSTTTRHWTARQASPSRTALTPGSRRPWTVPPLARPTATPAPATSRNSSGSPMERPIPLHDAVLEGHGHGPGPVRDSELGEDPLQVGLHRLGGDLQGLGHLAVGGAVGDHL